MAGALRHREVELLARTVRTEAETISANGLCSICKRTLHGALRLGGGMEAAPFEIWPEHNPHRARRVAARAPHRQPGGVRAVLGE